MKVITAHMLSLQFDADQITSGDDSAQVHQAVELINSVLQRQPYALGAQLLTGIYELEIESETDSDESGEEG